MIKNIVVEGPNNVGKTTFINELKKRIEFKNWIVEHCTSTSPNDYEFYKCTLLNCENYIFDRHCIGETVYPVLFKRESNFYMKDAIELVNKCNDTLFIFIDADFRFIRDAYNRKTELLDWDMVTRERVMFNDAYMNVMDCDNVMLYNHSLNVQTFIDAIVAKYLEARNGNIGSHC